MPVDRREALKRTGRELLKDAGAADDIFNLFEFGREEVGEVLASFGADDDIFIADVAGFVVDARLGIDGEDVAGLEGAAVVGAVVVDGEADRMGEDTAPGFDHGAGRFLILGLGELPAGEDGFHSNGSFFAELIAVAPGRIRAMMESRYPRTKPSSSFCTGLNLPLTGHMRVTSLV